MLIIGIIVSSIGGGILGYIFSSMARQADMRITKDGRTYLALGGYILALLGQHIN